MNLINGVHGNQPLHGGPSLRRGLEWISSTVCMGTIPYMGVRPQGGGWNGSHQRCAWEPSLTWESVPKEGVGMDLINGVHGNHPLHGVRP